MTERTSRTVRITNDLGMHLRAAGAFVQLAGRFSSEIWVERSGTRVNGKSIMSVLTLAASKGAELTLIAVGADAQAAVDALASLVERQFEIQG